MCRVHLLTVWTFYFPLTALFTFQKYFICIILLLYAFIKCFCLGVPMILIYTYSISLKISSLPSIFPSPSPACSVSFFRSIHIPLWRLCGYFLYYLLYMYLPQFTNIHPYIRSHAPSPTDKAAVNIYTQPPEEPTWAFLWNICPGISKYFNWSNADVI